MINKKLYIFDLDGTLYLDGVLFPYTLNVIARLKKSGALICYLTNNSSRSTNEYYMKLRKLGLDLQLSDIITSTQAAISYIKKYYPTHHFLVIGTESMRGEVANSGIMFSAKINDDTNAVLMGYDSELTYQKIFDATKLLITGVPYIATNPDKVCPVNFGFVPDCGSFADMLDNAVHRQPLFMGKPNRQIIDEALSRYSVQPEQAVIVGDRLYTDIQCGINAGIDTVLVLSGETKQEHLMDSKIKPTYTFNTIAEMVDSLDI